LKITGVKIVFINNSLLKTEAEMPYVLITVGKKIDIIQMRTALKIVAMKPARAGRKIPSMLRTVLSIPELKPIIVRSKQFNPSGVPLIKSSMRPEIKPRDSPYVLPLCNEI
jgi:hypothetical protein